MFSFLSTILSSSWGLSKIVLKADIILDYTSHSSAQFLNSLKKETISPKDGSFESFQIHSRPLGNVIYIITSLWTKHEVMRAMEEVIARKISKL